MGFTKEDLKHINSISDKISKLENDINNLRSCKSMVYDNYGNSFLSLFKPKRKLFICGVIKWSRDKKAYEIELDEASIDAIIKINEDRLSDLNEQFNNYKIL